MKDKKKKTYQNIILIITIIIIIIGTGFYININQEKYFNEGVIYGQQTVADIIITEINTKGVISFENGNQTLNLVSSESIGKNSQNMLSEIKNSIYEKGYVIIIDSITGEELILIEYQEEFDINEN